MGSDDGAGLSLVELDAADSDDPLENRLDRRRLDFFLSPSMAGRSG